jgi:D-alanyl-lipoteichoic acid acyltransferase DltB (MBOAT superfamily)
MNIQVDPLILNVILPVGISFYTFQSLSYTLDVYRDQLKPTQDWVAFFAYVSFFPQLVAGPIERASHLLPQFESQRVIRKNDLSEGIWLMIWGMFKKVVVADNMAPLVDMVYQENSGVVGPVILLATLAFGFQIYCDFSGYSDIARGVARILGFDLMFNFNLPYFATSPSDFWRRWHISLSTWFRDYLYIPLGGSRNGRGNHLLNLLLTMTVAGLWHGAGWNFLLWGVWHGLALCLFLRFKPVSTSAKVFGWMITMVIVFAGWALFRCVSLEQVWFLLSHLGSSETPIWFLDYVIRLSLFVSPLILMQIWQAISNHNIPSLACPKWVHYGLQSVMIYLVILFWNTGGTPFIYFQF